MNVSGKSNDKTPVLSASETRDAMCTAALFTNTVGMMYCFNEQIHLHKEKRNRWMKAIM